MLLVSISNFIMSLKVKKVKSNKSKYEFTRFMTGKRHSKTD